LPPASTRGLLLVADLMQRYNPLFDRVGALLRGGALGELLHGYFENYASDESLPADHWFWDREKSGGILVEHGVHFFDLFRGWLGEGQVVAAQRSLRPVTGLEEQVQCTLRFAGGVLVNLYHGFHQPGRLDRQELRLVFERGEVTLYGWVPTRARVHGVADEEASRALVELFPGGRLDSIEIYGGATRSCRGRGKTLDLYQELELAHGEGERKMPRYGELLRSLLADQLAWVRDRSHRRRVTEEDGRASLAMALAADHLATGAAGARKGE
jgi:predicted dehydrogenase